MDKNEEHDANTEADLHASETSGEKLLSEISPLSLGETHCFKTGNDFNTLDFQDVGGFKT